MVDLPADLTDFAFDAKFKKGMVAKVEGFVFADGTTRDKYIVVLNRDASASQAIFFLTTSKTEFYKTNTIAQTNAVVVPPGKVSFFPLETVVNCREAHSMKRVDMKKKFGDHQLTFKGHLPDDVLLQIEAVVSKSILIPPAITKMILDDPGS